ncbi:MAG: 16S rRNA (cytosine(1402)-N(4))-methyltransferase RsmH [Actinobacteria bacterium]|nr:16S rRNA (cytosine(1402)-N(4))-methyltransferase RsmH [Actinomycetota bacterium]
MQLNDSIQGLPSNGSAHVPVLAAELLNLLDPQPDDTIIDCTFGAGGHARKVARELGQDAVFIGVDRDPVAKRYFDLFSQYQPFRCRFVHGNFADALEDMNQNGFEADLIYLDLGVSSMQLDRPERGFSYSYNAPLDMRMDPSGKTTARQLINELPYAELTRIFKRYGEERYASQIARRICRERDEKPFETTLQLVDTVKAAIPTPARFGAGHPARRVFQALRIAVNDELDSLERGLENALSLLAPGGRLAVISFHSLEDRIAKQFFAARIGKCTCPPDLPRCVCEAKAELRIVTRRPIAPSEEEIAENPRAQSAKLRVVEKLG